MFYSSKSSSSYAPNNYYYYCWDYPLDVSFCSYYSFFSYSFCCRSTSSKNLTFFFGFPKLSLFPEFFPFWALSISSFSCYSWILCSISSNYFFAATFTLFLSAVLVNLFPSSPRSSSIKTLLNNPFLFKIANSSSSSSLSLIYSAFSSCMEFSLLLFSFLVLIFT